MPDSRNHSPICAHSAGFAPQPSTNVSPQWPQPDESSNPTMATISPAEAALRTSASQTTYRAREAEAGSPSKFLLSGPSKTAATLNPELLPVGRRESVVAYLYLSP